jgi:hypothetical protein
MFLEQAAWRYQKNIIFYGFQPHSFFLELTSEQLQRKNSESVVLCQTTIAAGE